MDEFHSPMNSVIAKRLWNFLKISFFMMKKGLISKRKLVMDMNLVMKKGKLLRKTLRNLIFHHHSYSRNATSRGGFGLQDYEFSCSNSPNPVFFHVTKRKHHYFPSIPCFPCINPPDDSEESDEPKAVSVKPKINYSPEHSYSFRFDTNDFAPGENLSPPLPSPFSVRISNYSSEDDIEGCNKQVDNDAEEFIRRFYEQLRVQSRRQLLDYQEMLARGTG